MPRPSTIDRLPETVRAEIGRLRQNGRTIDEILTHLRKLDGIAPVSRTALGRHIKGLDILGERLRRSRQISEALVAQLGDAPESQSARIGIELVQTAVMDLFSRGAGSPGACLEDEHRIHRRGREARDRTGEAGGRGEGRDDRGRARDQRGDADGDQGRDLRDPG